MIAPMVVRHFGILAPALVSMLLLGAASSTSCIIPDHGIVALVDCGVRWCATAEYAQALDDANNPVDIQEPQPDGTSDWVTECVCMRPLDDGVLRAEAPAMQYEILRNQVLDAARQACIDRAIANQLAPDPPPPDDALLDVTCTEAVTTIFRDGCCQRRSDECDGYAYTCDADLDPTEGDSLGPYATIGGDDSGADSTGADSSTGEMVSLAPFYAEVSCAGTTCRIGQPLIDAILGAPEAVLAEGTSLAFASVAGKVVGLELRGVEPDNLAGHLGLRDGDLILRVGELPLTTEAELFAAARSAHDAEHITVLVERNGATHLRHFIRTR
jgi:hypothetical protein